MLEDYIVSLQMVRCIQSGPLLEWHKKRLKYLEPIIKEIKEEGGFNGKQEMDT